mgnify:CR=1 FL=1
MVFVYVDADDQGNGSFDRSRKDSFFFYKDLIATRGANIFKTINDNKLSLGFFQLSLFARKENDINGNKIVFDAPWRDLI